MTIQEAFEELKRLFPDSHIEAAYSLNNFGNKDKVEILCTVYQSEAGKNIAHGNTWRDAIRRITPPPPDAKPDPIEPCDDTDLLDHERLEDARLERLEVERERREVRG